MSISSSLNRECMEPDIRIDILRGREIRWIASNVDRVLILIHPHVVQAQHSRERNVRCVNRAEVVTHAQIREDVLVHDAV